jgi:hypothetical protein
LSQPNNFFWNYRDTTIIIPGCEPELGSLFWGCVQPEQCQQVLVLSQYSVEQIGKAFMIGMIMSVMVKRLLQGHALLVPTPERFTLIIKL